MIAMQPMQVCLYDQLTRTRQLDRTAIHNLYVQRNIFAKLLCWSFGNDLLRLYWPIGKTILHSFYHFVSCYCRNQHQYVEIKEVLNSLKKTIENNSFPWPHVRYFSFVFVQAYKCDRDNKQDGQL